MTGVRWIALAYALVFGVAFPAGAQEPVVDAVVALREASRQEAAGELANAERLLRSILRAQPTSAPALLAMERVLRHQGRLAELPPYAEAAVALEPASAMLNQVLLRTYSALDREAQLEAAGAAWMDASPGIEIPYREAARAWEARGDYHRARSILEMGRERVDAADALALELGSLYAALDQPAMAAAEWDRALGPEAYGLSQIRRRLRTLPDGGAGVLGELVDRLGQGTPTTPRLGAAMDLAIDAGLEATGITLGQKLVPGLPGSERRARLLDVARRAEGARMTNLARWAYGELVADGGAEGLHAIRERYAALALEVGDSVGAASAYGALAADGEASVAQRRQAAALRVELLAAQDPVAAVEPLRAFRERNEGAAETDRLSAAVGEALLVLGRDEDAERLLAGVRGPRSALVRGRIALARGAREDARSAFMDAAPGLRGAEGTQTLSLAVLLGRISDSGARVLGRLLVETAAGDPGGALDRLTEAAETLDPAERAALLEFAAGVADDARLDADAVRLRRMIVADHPRSGEAPAALLALARGVSSDDDSEARELLERLILEYPRSTLVPQARRALAELGRRGNGSIRDSGSR
jgi:hypothetical protein